ncbi:class I SAM-dependent methyltransferase [Paenibacillus flagellatus]|uniref:Class I SAM-dependent methyltransferase n=1 Tax=Paenibacillus flagellatus TaxID=2211139 RepID=A0A2V5K7I9_9BACL|nr:class I SAM-dependent methyltransferase [Paenibacillus flagellatus]PYI53763.1 class I SAM-dependent methyltransferase [Paenibacillus flagellatus]
MGEWKERTGESKARWEAIAPFWDEYMGESSNRFHREIVRPATERLLAVREGWTVLDIGCGNGNFSRRLADLGATVTAFDYSANMIERARARSAAYGEAIDYRVADATDGEALLALGADRYDGAVANMALMDIADVTPLAKALAVLLKTGAPFVFSIPHPCFQPPRMRKVHETEDADGAIVTRSAVQIASYLTPEYFPSIGIRGQPVPHYIFHRPLSYYTNLLFDRGFAMDGMEEPSFAKDERAGERFDWYDIPPAVVLRFRKR